MRWVPSLLVRDTTMGRGGRTPWSAPCGCGGRPCGRRPPHPLATTFRQMEFQRVVERRRMVRRYDMSRPVSPEVVDAVVGNALRAPSAGFTQGTAFLVLDRVDDVAGFREAATPSEDAARYYAATFAAPVVIVPCANKDAYLDRYALADKGRTDRSDAWWPAPFWDIDAGFATLLMLLTATDAGLGACFFGIPKECLG